MGIFQPQFREYFPRNIGNFYAAIDKFNKLAAEDENYVKENAEHFVSSINSYLGFMKHYSSYKIRRKMISNDISEAWKAVFTVDERMNKITLRKECKPAYQQKQKLRRQRINRRRNRRKRGRGQKFLPAVGQMLNPFV